MSMKTNRIEIGIYNFLNTFHKTNDIDKSFQKIKQKLKCEDEYARYIISECVTYEYFSGINFTRSINHSIHLDIRNHKYITRKGYQFIHDYKINKLNFFWIPFKNLVIIVITAFITVIVGNFFSNNKQSIEVSDNIVPQISIEVPICDNSND